MKLMIIKSNIEEKLSEFSLWVTPSLGDFRDSEEFTSILLNIQDGFEILSKITDHYRSIKTCTPQFITKRLLIQINSLAQDIALEYLIKVFSILFMVTGKSDNNLKCQFPIYLKQHLSQEYILKISKSKLIRKTIPSTLEATTVASIISKLFDYYDEQNIFLNIYINFILSDINYIKQLWSIGYSYLNLKTYGAEKALITPLAIFKYRGSLTAIQGHSPEHMLRDKLNEWGLIKDLDYNSQDISVNTLLGEEFIRHENKHRKYDFILPYLSRNDGHKIFIQCQFYASDSGSVSHKNVDQTTSTRNYTKTQYPPAMFIEYVDGAGYCSSLNGDLKRLLCMPDTTDFFQIRTAPIKLRRNFQEIHFLTLLEVEQAILSAGETEDEIISFLLNQGYSEDEIQRCLRNSIEHGLLCKDKNRFSILDGRKSIVRRYFLLDGIAVFGQAIPTDKLLGNLLIPGFSTYWGLPQNKLITKLLETIPALRFEWKKMEDAFNDLQWLIDKKYIFAK